MALNPEHLADERAVLLHPAYGRAYADEAALLADWHAGKDFSIRNGPYCSCRDGEKFREMGYTAIVILWRRPNSVELFSTLITL